MGKRGARPTRPADYVPTSRRSGASAPTDEPLALPPKGWPDEASNWSKPHAQWTTACRAKWKMIQGCVPEGYLLASDLPTMLLACETWVELDGLRGDFDATVVRLRINLRSQLDGLLKRLGLVGSWRRGADAEAGPASNSALAMVVPLRAPEREPDAPRAKTAGKKCGARTSKGTPCRLLTPCRYHAPDGWL